MTTHLEETNGSNSPSSRTVSFSTTSSPLTRSRTPSNPKGSEAVPLLVAFDIPPSPSRPGLAIAPQPTPTWTSAQDERLVVVRASLKEAQRRWSASQEIWLEEEHALLELRSQHRKALKQQQHEKDLASKAAGVWKAKTWGRRLSWKGSRSGSAAITTAEGDVGDDDGKKKADEVEYAADQGDVDDDDDAQNDDEAAVAVESSDEDNDNGKQVPRPTIPRTNTSNTISTALHRLSMHVRRPSGAGKSAHPSQRTSRRTSKNASRAPSYPASRGISPLR